MLIILTIESYTKMQNINSYKLSVDTKIEEEGC